MSSLHAVNFFTFGAMRSCRDPIFTVFLKHRVACIRAQMVVNHRVEIEEGLIHMVYREVRTVLKQAIRYSKEAAHRCHAHVSNLLYSVKCSLMINHVAPDQLPLSSGRAILSQQSEA